MSAFREGKADILIGTQMIVKGHDFPNVTLVAALAADMSMFEQDYQSSERTFQLLQQASGRAGRGEKPGEVIIQTYKPEHYVIESIRKHDDTIFYENELAYRRMLGYPPCKAMLRVMISAEKKEECEEILQKMAEWISQRYARKSQRVRAIRRWTSKAERPFPLAADDQRSGDGDASWNQGRNYRMDGKQTTFMLCAV